MSRTTLVFTTIMRPASAEQFLVSIRRHHPDLPVIVAEQAETPELRELCDLHGAKHLALPFDCGISTARNALVREADTEFFILAEDDMLIEQPLPISLAEGFLRSHPEYLCVVGKLDDYDEDGKLRSLSRINNLMLDRTGGGLIKLPVELVEPEPLVFDGELFIPCDYGPDWGLFRREAISACDLWWDEQFQIGGQHLDFFLRAQAAGAKVAYLPAFLCAHHRVRAPEYLLYRNRPVWIERFAAKWRLRYFHEVGADFRFYSDYSRPVPVALPERRRIEALERQNKSLRDQRQTLVDRIQALQERLR